MMYHKISDASRNIKNYRDSKNIDVDLDNFKKHLNRDVSNIENFQ